jgi:hypothetical protein
MTQYKQLRKERTMASRKETSNYDFTGHKTITVSKQDYEALRHLSNTMYDIPISYGKTIKGLLNFYNEYLQFRKKKD